MKKISLLLLISSLLSCVESKKPDANKTPFKKKLKALIVDGHNNHGIWPKTTMMMKDYLTETDLFEVDIARTNNNWVGPHFDSSIGLDTIIELLTMYPLAGQADRKVVESPEPDPTFSPNFENYDLVVSNMGWKAAPWPEETRKNFEKYMSEGGGFVSIHAANNSWPAWKEFNKMIGIGGWSDRTTTKDGPQIYYDAQGKMQKQTTEHNCGSHGPQMEFVIETRAAQHPIMKGLPMKWLHQKDELYERLCGPAENVTILATAFSDELANGPPWDKTIKGANRNEPILMCIDYGKGRVFHSTLGHMDYSMACVGFITTFQRGCEWAATGNVTLKVPENFPTETTGSAIAWKN